MEEIVGSNLALDINTNLPDLSQAESILIPKTIEEAPRVQIPESISGINKSEASEDVKLIQLQRPKQEAQTKVKALSFEERVAKKMDSFTESNQAVLFEPVKRDPLRMQGLDTSSATKYKNFRISEAFLNQDSLEREIQLSSEQGSWEKATNVFKQIGAMTVTGLGIGALDVVDPLISMAGNKTLDPFTNYEYSPLSRLGDWAREVNENSINYRTREQIEHPLLSLITSPTTGLAELGKGLGLVAGIAAGSIAQGFALTAMTGGAGLVPALAMKIKTIANLGKVYKTAKLGSVLTDGVQAANSIDNVYDASKGFGTIDNIASTARGLSAVATEASSAVLGSNKSFATIKAITAARGEGVMAGADARHNLLTKQLDSFAQNNGGLTPSDEEYEKMKSIAQDAADITTKLYTAATYLGNKLLGDKITDLLFKPKIGGISELGKRAGIDLITDNGILKEAEKKSIKFFSNVGQGNVITRNLTKGADFVLDKGKDFGSKLAGLEAIEEGQQFWIDKAVENYYTTVYNGKANDSFIGGLTNSFADTSGEVFSDDGLKSMIIGLSTGTAMTKIMSMVESKDKKVFKEELLKNIVPQINSQFSDMYDSVSSVNSIFDELNKKDKNFVDAVNISSVNGKLSDNLEHLKGLNFAFSQLEKGNISTEQANKLKDVALFHAVMPYVGIGQGEYMKQMYNQKLDVADINEYNIENGTSYQTIDEVKASNEKLFSIIDDVTSQQEAINKNFPISIKPNDPMFNAYIQARNVLSYNVYLSNLYDGSKEDLEQTYGKDYLQSSALMSIMDGTVDTALINDNKQAVINLQNELETSKILFDTNAKINETSPLTGLKKKEQEDLLLKIASINDSIERKESFGQFIEEYDSLTENITDEKELSLLEVQRSKAINTLAKETYGFQFDTDEQEEAAQEAFMSYQKTNNSNKVLIETFNFLKENWTDAKAVEDKVNRLYLESQLHQQTKAQTDRRKNNIKFQEAFVDIRQTIFESIKNSGLDSKAKGQLIAYMNGFNTLNFTFKVEDVDNLIKYLPKGIILDPKTRTELYDIANDVRTGVKRTKQKTAPTTTTQPTATTVIATPTQETVTITRDEILYSIQQLENDINNRVQSFISNGAPKELAEELAKQEFDESENGGNKIALESLRKKLKEIEELELENKTTIQNRVTPQAVKTEPAPTPQKAAKKEKQKLNEDDKVAHSIAWLTKSINELPQKFNYKKGEGLFFGDGLVDNNKYTKNEVTSLNVMLATLYDIEIDAIQFRPDFIIVSKDYLVGGKMFSTTIEIPINKYAFNKNNSNVIELENNLKLELAKSLDTKVYYIKDGKVEDSTIGLFAVSDVEVFTNKQDALNVLTKDEIDADDLGVEPSDGLSPNPSANVYTPNLDSLLENTGQVTLVDGKVVFVDQKDNSNAYVGDKQDENMLLAAMNKMKNQLMNFIKSSFNMTKYLKGLSIEVETGSKTNDAGTKEQLPYSTFFTRGSSRGILIKDQESGELLKRIADPNSVRFVPLSISQDGEIQIPAGLAFRDSGFKIRIYDTVTEKFRNLNKNEIEVYKKIQKDFPSDVTIQELVNSPNFTSTAYDLLQRLSMVRVQDEKVTDHFNIFSTYTNDKETGFKKQLTHEDYIDRVNNSVNAFSALASNPSITGFERLYNVSFLTDDFIKGDKVKDPIEKNPGNHVETVLEIGKDGTPNVIGVNAIRDSNGKLIFSSIGKLEDALLDDKVKQFISDSNKLANDNSSEMSNGTYVIIKKYNRSDDGFTLGMVKTKFSSNINTIYNEASTEKYDLKNNQIIGFEDGKSVAYKVIEVDGKSYLVSNEREFDEATKKYKDVAGKGINSVYPIARENDLSFIDNRLSAKDSQALLDKAGLVYEGESQTYTDPIIYPNKKDGNLDYDKLEIASLNTFGNISGRYIIAIDPKANIQESQSEEVLVIIDDEIINTNEGGIKSGQATKLDNSLLNDINKVPSFRDLNLTQDFEKELETLLKGCQ